MRQKNVGSGILNFGPWPEKNELKSQAGPWALAKCQKMQLNTSLLNIMLPKYDLVAGYVGLVVGARWGALGEGMLFSHSKSAHLLI